MAQPTSVRVSWIQIQPWCGEGADHYGMNYMALPAMTPKLPYLQRTFYKLHEGQEPNWIDGLFASIHRPKSGSLANKRQPHNFQGRPAGQKRVHRWQ